MPDFAYVAVGASGQRFEGTATAANEDALAKMLRGREQYLVEANVAGSDEIDLSEIRILERITRRDVIFFTTQLSTIVATGVNLVEGLVDVEAQSTKHAMKKVIADMRRDIESGASLSGALQRHPAAFDELYVAIVRSGEATGHVDRALDDLIIQLEWQDRLAQRIREATTYPLMIVGLLVVLLSVLVGFTIPRFTQIYQRVNVNLKMPLPTRIVQTVATGIASNWYVIVAVIVIGYMWYQLRIQTADGKVWAARTTLRIPVVGEAVRKVAFARFAHYFGTLHESGLEVAPSLTLMEHVLGNAYLAQRFRLAVNRVMAGEPLSRALAAVGEFPPLVIQMLALGEKTGQMSKALEQVRKYYDREVDQSVTRALTLFGPIALLALASVFVLIAVAFYLPLFNLARAVR